MIGVDSPVSIYSKIVLVPTCACTSVKIASVVHSTFVAVDGPSAATFLFRCCSTALAIIATDVNVLIVETSIRPGTKDIVAF